jgi:hypothetical protein
VPSVVPTLSPPLRRRRLSVAALLTTALIACAWLFAGGAAPTAIAQGDSCPNADLRGQQGAQHLPDCRAYEQVSPIDKNNNHIGIASYLGTGSGPVIGQDGAAAYTSNGAFAGTPGASVLSAYAGARNDDGWQTSPLSPPLVAGGGTANGSMVLGTTSDFSMQLSASGGVLAPGALDGLSNFYVHDSADDSYELIAADPDSLPITNCCLGFGGASPDGSSWFFDSKAGPLDSTPPPAYGENIYQYVNGELKLAGVDENGDASPQGSKLEPSGFSHPQVARHAVSADGSQAYWMQDLPGPLTPAPIYLYEGGTTSALVTERETDNTEQAGLFLFATPDGSQAFLTSEDQLTADASPSGFDLYRYDRDANGGDGDLVDLTPTGASADVEGVLDVSHDGSYVYFQATGDLALGATAGDHNIYVWHDGQIRLVATSANGFDDLADTEIGDFRASPNGRYLGFIIGGDLDGPNPQPDPGAAQAYLYDYEEDTLDCASCPPGVDPPSGDVGFQPSLNGLDSFTLPSSWWGLTRNVRDDGRLFFHSPDALVGGDTNGRTDVYQYSDDELDLISTGRSPEDSFFGDASPDGNDVYFLTISQLVGQDNDSLYDLYDARVDGGLASQNEVPEAECSGDECQGEQSGAPADDVPATGGTGAGNPTPTPSCDSQKASVDRYDDRIAKLKDKKKRAKRKAKQASGKKAQRKRKRAKRIGKKIRKVRGKKRDAKRDLRSCREAS